MSRSRIPVIFSTCKLQAKRVHYWDEIHGNREEYIHGRKCDKGYDGRLPGKTDTGIFYPYAVRAAYRLPDKFWKYYQKYKNREINVAEFARLMKCSRVTIYKYLSMVE